MVKISVSDVEGEVNYEEVMNEFGIKSITPFLKKMKKPPLIYRRGIVFAQRDFKQIYDAIINKKPFAVVTGINPSGTLHLGNKLIIDQAKFFQEQGADVFIPISNDETYVFGKAKSLEKATKTALENVIPDLIALGLKEKKTKIFISTMDKRIYELSVKLSTKVTFSSIKAIFGFTNDTNPGQIFYGVVQSAHILLPEIEEFGGPKPVVVPIGIDQDPYMRLCRDIASKVGMIKPSSTYHRFLPGLQGGKMSASKPETCIFLSDSPETAKKKIMKAFSGGAPTLEEHRKKGGNPDIDVPFQYLRYIFEEDDKKLQDIRKSYRSGEMHSGEMKNYLAEKVVKFLKEHQRKRERAKKRINDFLLND
jgi:tryptophanyl-tRNA synthetase